MEVLIFFSYQICFYFHFFICIFIFIFIFSYAFLHLFIFIFSGDDVPRKKPDPLIYNTAQKFLGIPPERWFYRLLNNDFLIHLATKTKRPRIIIQNIIFKFLNFLSSINKISISRTFEYIFCVEFPIMLNTIEWCNV